MTTDFIYSAYFWNQTIFFLLLCVFFVVGRKVAKYTIKDKKENRKGYEAITISSPTCFLISYFVVAAVNKNVMDESATPFSILIDWLIIITVGAIFSFFVFRSMKKKYKT